MNVYRWKITAKVKKLVLISFFILFILYLMSQPSSEIVQQKSEYAALSVIHRFYYKNLIKNINFTKAWLNDRLSACKHNFMGYGHQFARLKNAILNPDPSHGQFKLPCDKDQLPSYGFLSQTHEVQVSYLDGWMKTLETINSKPSITHDRTTLVVRRYEFVNLYHQMTDFYNAFLVMKLLNLDPTKVDILLADRYAPGSLDSVWGILYGNCTKIGDLNQPIQYKDVLWAALGYNSPLNFHSLTSVPLIEEFSQFFTLRHGATEKKSLNCNGISILFIWRHDYFSIPGQPKRNILAKVQNEQELIDAVQERFPGHYVAGIQMDQQDMRDQVQWLSQTDILVGMHGAGMSGILSLPPHAGVLELFPLYYHFASFGRNHFRAMAQWRKLHYLQWQNANPTNEYPDSFTYIPEPVIIQRLLSLYYSMCGHTPAS